MVMKRQSTETAQNLILDEVTPQFVPGRRRRTSPPPVEASNLGVDVFEPARMAEIYADLGAAQSLHETMEKIVHYRPSDSIPSSNSVISTA
jgi:hypothetical protein